MRKEAKKERKPENNISEESKPVSREQQIKDEKKTFKIIILTMIGLVLFFLAFFVVVNYTAKFKVGGVNFEIDTKDLAGKVIYKTSLPVYGKNESTGKLATGIYNLYLRNDPRNLEEVQFDGKINLKKNMVLNMEKDFSCDGDGIIGIANILNLYGIIGTSVIKDENASCDSQGMYAFVDIKEGNETRIEQFGPACYNIYVKDCEILKATERFMLETLSEVNEEID